VFLLSKSPRYFFDADAIREPHKEPWRGQGEAEKNNWSVNGERGSHDTVRQYNPAGRNVRSVWEIEQTGRERGGTKHTLIEDYFNDIYTEEQAYWLGFLYADGYLGRRHVDLQLAAKDAGHVERFQRALGSSREVTISRDGRARFIASSLRMANDLGHLGMRERSTMPILNGELTRHFVRGVFDGDGSAWSYLPAGRTKRRYGAAFLGSQGLLDEIREELGLRGKPKFSRGIHRLSVAAGDDIARLYAYLYDGATVWLERKRVEFPQAQSIAPATWSIATQPYPEAHFATFPEELVRRCVLAGCPEFVCSECYTPCVNAEATESDSVQAALQRMRPVLRGSGKDVLQPVLSDDCGKPSAREEAAPAVPELWEARQDDEAQDLFDQVRRPVGNQDGGESSPIPARAPSGELEGRQGDRRERLRAGLQSPEASIPARTPSGDGAEARAVADAGRVRPSSQRDQDGQPARELGADDAESASGNGGVSPLRRAVRDSLSPCCGAPLSPGIVLDPFIGSGTTGLVARKHGRHAIGIELNADYCELASRRLAQQSLLTELA
jgi:hypothetical protein